MYKAILILTILLVAFPILMSGQEQSVNVETESSSPYVDKILNGPITIEGLRQMPYKVWFVKNFKTYLPDTETLQEIPKKQLENVKILAFMGTWCHDSNREIPRLVKVCEELGISERLELYAVDVDKTSRLEKEKGWELKRTPTIIVLRNGEELGRILEEPEVSFEHSLSLILK